MVIQTCAAGNLCLVARRATCSCLILVSFVFCVRLLMPSERTTCSTSVEAAVFFVFFGEVCGLDGVAGGELCGFRVVTVTWLKFSFLLGD